MKRAYRIALTRVASAICVHLGYSTESYTLGLKLRDHQEELETEHLIASAERILERAI